MNRPLRPEDWGLRVGAGGELLAGSFRVADLARKFGTPLHVLQVPYLEDTALRFRRTFEAVYPGRTSVHYALKCNSLPVVVRAMKRAGLKAEVMSPFELDLAVSLGFAGEDIVVNGPGKTPAFLEKCLERGTRLINIDSLEEMALLDGLAGRAGRRQDILLRLNPDRIPRGLNRGAATGSRKGCALGLDLKGGEVRAALDRLGSLPGLRFRGYHFHIGTGIRDPREYSRTLASLAPLFRETRAAGLSVTILDVGGGFASPTTREMSSRELLVYQAWERLPDAPSPSSCASFEGYAREISAQLRGIFPRGEEPELILEPGRSIASASQFLLLTVRGVKSRPGAGTWLITDGGLGTVCLPTFYEYHEILLADDVLRPRLERATITGQVCFASDIVYRNKPMPAVKAGEVLAVMDSGAYFLALESSFGFPRPAVLAVNGSTCALARRGETFEDMVGRDRAGRAFSSKEVHHEVRCHQERVGPVAGPDRPGDRPYVS